jgi:hypothetical protein
MPTDEIDAITAWIGEHVAVSITIAAAVALAVLAAIGMQAWAAYRGRSLTARASAFFGVVQTGVAFVTITGVYEFWADVVKVNPVEAAGIAVFIEAVTWAAVADIFVHGADKTTTGIGRSGPLFWSAIVGGGLMAIIGSDDPGTAVGRTVVVALGAMMWHVRIRQRTRPKAGQGRWANPFKTFALRQGWMIADDTDLTQTSREWQVRTLTRAINKVARSGRVHTITRMAGERTIRRVMEAGDAAMVRDARDRYALQEVLRKEITPTSTSMSAAIDAARLALYPPSAPPQGEEPPAPPPAEVAPKLRPKAPRRVPAPPAPRTSAAAAARQDPEATEALRERATSEAMEALAKGDALTSKGWGLKYGKGEEWGRQRLADARKRLDNSAADTILNGSRVG